MIASDLLEFDRNSVNVIGICINFVGIFVVDLLGMEAIDENWGGMLRVWPIWFVCLFVFLNDLN